MSGTRTGFWGLLEGMHYREHGRWKRFEKLLIADASEKVENYINFGTLSVPGRFWEYAMQYADAVQKYSNRLLDEAADRERDVATQITAFKNTIHSVISHAGALEKDFETTLREKGITLEDVSDELSVLYQRIVDELQEEFPSPDKAPSHEQRQEMAKTVLDKAENAVIKYAVDHDMAEANVEALNQHFEKLKSIVMTLVVATGGVFFRRKRMRTDTCI